MAHTLEEPHTPQPDASHVASAPVLSQGRASLGIGRPSLKGETISTG